MKKTINKWHFVVICITTIILALSALPTFYGKHPVVSMQGASVDTELPSISSIKASLKDSQFDVATIRITDNKMFIQPSSNNADIAQLREHLSQDFGKPFAIHIDEVEASPRWLQAMGFNAIKLGLDLNGGVLFELHVDLPSAINERMQGMEEELRLVFQQERIRGLNAEFDADMHINVSYRNDVAYNKLKVILKTKFPDLNIIKETPNSVRLAWGASKLADFEQALMQQSVSIMRNRIESLGITEAAISRQGKQDIRIELPGIKDPQQAAKIIGSTATLDVFSLAKNGLNANVLTNKQGQAIAVNKKPVFSGHNIQNATAGTDEYGIPMVNLVLDSQGGDKMSRFSKANIGQAMVTVLSEYQQDIEGKLKKHSEVINVATIQAQLGNRFSITNMPSAHAAQELAMLIRAGSLNAPVSIIEQRTIDSSLGEENVHSGFAALVLGLAITLTFMALWYRKLGLIANASLVINLLCLLGLMAWLPGVVLTLPGIAGLVLTIGMAVDTNVLVFERIKQQAQQNRSPAAAIESGYQRALTTILDANITTMICAVILFSMGNGPVKGFAITLSLGLITSMFSGVFVAKFLSRLFPADSLVCQKEAL